MRTGIKLAEHVQVLALFTAFLAEVVAYLRQFAFTGVLFAIIEVMAGNCCYMTPFLLQIADYYGLPLDFVGFHELVAQAIEGVDCWHYSSYFMSLVCLILLNSSEAHLSPLISWSQFHDCPCCYLSLPFKLADFCFEIVVLVLSTRAARFGNLLVVWQGSFHLHSKAALE